MSLLPCIIDTDVGPDDLLGLAYLLANPDLHIEAITVCNGLCRPERGAENILRVLALFERKDIEVLIGRSTPLKGNTSFPKEWCRLSESLEGVSLPEIHLPSSFASATEYLVKRMAEYDRPLRILTFGPLTNIAEAFQEFKGRKTAIEEIMIMGGAFDVRGNLYDFDEFVAPNDVAEWNIFIDPVAAEWYIRNGHYYAWDPLTAVAFLEREVMVFKNGLVEVQCETPHQGKTLFHADESSNCCIAVDASSRLFEENFFRPFT